MASGIAVNQKCLDSFKKLNKREYSTVILHINKELTEVSVDKVYPPGRGDPEAEWKEMIKGLPVDDCRYIVTDFSWKDTPTVVCSKVIMIMWCPDDSPPRPKMAYASSMEACTTKISVQKTMQATDLDEVEYAAVKTACGK